MTIGKLGKLELISTNLRSMDNNLFFHPLSLFSNTTTEIVFRDTRGFLWTGQSRALALQMQKRAPQSELILEISLLDWAA